VTGKVASRRLVGGAKSDLQFDILTRLRKEGVMISETQTMIIERKNGQMLLKDAPEE